MRRVIGFGLLVVSLGACTQAVDFPAETTAPVPVQCTHALAILNTSDPFHEALEQWVRAPLGDRAAIRALDAACAAGHQPGQLGTELAACTLLGLVYSAGEGVKRDSFRAASYFQGVHGCENFDFGGDELAQAREQAIFTGSAACCAAMGCTRGCETECALARHKVSHEITPLLESACRAGRGSACFLLAELGLGQYLRGIGSVEPMHAVDEAARSALYQRACNQGSGPACSTADRPEASCNAGWGYGCLERGRQVVAARGDVSDGVPWFEKACQLGESRVCNELGDMFSLGESVSVDHDRAVRNYANAWR